MLASRASRQPRLDTTSTIHALVGTGTLPYPTLHHIPLHAMLVLSGPHPRRSWRTRRRARCARWPGSRSARRRARPPPRAPGRPAGSTRPARPCRPRSRARPAACRSAAHLMRARRSPRRRTRPSLTRPTAYQANAPAARWGCRAVRPQAQGALGSPLHARPASLGHELSGARAVLAVRAQRCGGGRQADPPDPTCTRPVSLHRWLTHACAEQ